MPDLPSTASTGSKKDFSRAGPGDHHKGVSGTSYQVGLLLVQSGFSPKGQLASSKPASSVFIDDVSNTRYGGWLHVDPLLLSTTGIQF